MLQVAALVAVRDGATAEEFVQAARYVFATADAANAAVNPEGG